MKNLFAYGTLQEAAIQKSVFGRIIDGRPDDLPGYRSADIVVEGVTYLLAAPDKRRSLRGTVLRLTPAELRAADVYETRAYRRIEVVLRSGIKAWIYVEGKNPTPQPRRRGK